MRKLKFRAWDAVDERYHYWSIEACFAVGASAGCMEKYTFEQYTGLEDKNGKEIYEGDIVRYGNDNAAIIWRERNAEFGVKWLDCGVEDSISWQIGTEETPSEVIGNIHENPELLGEDEE